MAQYQYTQIPADTFQKLAENAGMLATTFDPDTREVSGQIGATTGGINVTCTPTFKDNGEDIDNCPKNTKELKVIESYECKVSGTMVTIDEAALIMLISAAAKTENKIAPTMNLEADHFNDLWYICDYGEGGFIAVKLLNALSTSGLSIQTSDKSKAQFAFEFTGHTSIADLDTVPMEFYIESTAAKQFKEEA